MRRFPALLIFLLGLIALMVEPRPSAAGIALPEDESAAIILAYHRVGEDSFPESNLTAEQFAVHLQELSGGGYNIIALPEAIRALKAGEKLPPRSIAITFEGAYTSAYENAMKPLLEKKIPFTVFFSSGYADDTQSGQHLDWNTLGKLQQSGLVSFGLLPASYMRLVDKTTEETLTQINKARIAFREHIKQEPEFFSYPFGEYSPALLTLIRDQGFTAAFGLHSGVAFAQSDFYALPRFTMTESYGDSERFQLVSNALPLPAEGIEPADPQITTDTPSIGFTIDTLLAPYTKSLSCFISGQPQPRIEILGENRVELRLAEGLSEEKTRVNCTMPGPSPEFGEQQKWRWFGMLLVNKAIAPEEELSSQTNTPPPDGLP